MSDPWIRVHAPRPAARVRLLCFPHAGGTSVAYRPWAARLPGDVEPCAVELPGHGTRFGEPLAGSLDAVLDALEASVDRLDDRPLALFGHSMGAVIAYELALRLQRRPNRAPVAVMVSGRRAPTVVHEEPSLLGLSDDAFVAAVSARYGGIPEELLEHRDLLELLMPILRSDLGLLEGHRISRDGVLDCPLVAFRGVEDRNVADEHLAAWAAHGGAGFEQHRFPGGHFYLKDEMDPLLRIVSRVLSTAAPSGVTERASG